MKVAVDVTGGPATVVALVTEVFGVGIARHEHAKEMNGVGYGCKQFGVLVGTFPGCWVKGGGAFLLFVRCVTAFGVAVCP